MVKRESRGIELRPERERTHLDHRRHAPRDRGQARLKWRDSALVLSPPAERLALRNAHSKCVSTAMTRCNESPKLDMCRPRLTRCANCRVCSGSVQRGLRAEASSLRSSATAEDGSAEAGLSAIRPRGARRARVTPVGPDGGKTLLR